MIFYVENIKKQGVFYPLKKAFFEHFSNKIPYPFIAITSEEIGITSEVIAILSELIRISFPNFGRKGHFFRNLSFDLKEILTYFYKRKYIYRRRCAYIHARERIFFLFEGRSQDSIAGGKPSSEGRFTPQKISNGQRKSRADVMARPLFHFRKATKMVICYRQSRSVRRNLCPFDARKRTLCRCHSSLF